MGACTSQVDLDPTPEIAVAKELRDVLADLLEWETLLGGFDTPAWNKARELINGIRVSEAELANLPQVVKADV